MDPATYGWNRRGAYDRVQTLIVDPFLAFSTYIGVLERMRGRSANTWSGRKLHHGNLESNIGDREGRGRFL